MDSQPHLTGYTLQYRASGSSTWVNWSNPGTSVSSAIITGLTADTSYEFRLSASNAGGSATSTTSATTDRIKLGSPALGTVTATSSNTINVNWSAVTNASGYTVQYATNAAFTTGVGTQQVNSQSTTSANLTGLTANTLYYVRIIATGTGAYSNSDYSVAKWETTFQPPLTPPSPPTGLTSSGQTDTNITLSWNAVTDSTSYKIERSLNGTSWMQIGGVLTAITYMDTGLTPDTSYHYRVSAVNAGGTSVPSNIVQIATPPVPPVEQPLDEVEILLATGTATAMTVTWTADLAAKSYVVEWSANGVDGWTAFDSVETGTATTAGTFTAGATYHVRVTAKAENIENDSFVAIPVTIPPTVDSFELTGITVNNNSPQVGDTISATLEPADATATYQWYRGGTVIIGATSNSYTVATEDIGYALRVVATGKDSHTGKQESVPTNIVESPVLPLDKPLLNTVSNTGKHHMIKAEWTPGANNANALSYEIRFYSDSSLTTRVHTEPADKNLTELEFAVNGLGVDTYYVVAVAIGDAVNFDTSTYTASDAKTITVTSNPAAIPLHIRVVQTGINAVIVSWNPVWNSSAGYQVWQHVSGEGEVAEWKLVATVTSTTATITGLTAGDYQFRVVAQGQPETRGLAEFSNSSASDTATITATGTIDVGSVNSNFRFQARADNRATTTTANSVTVLLNTNATRALEGILYYELAYGIRGGEMRTIVIAGDAKNAVIAGLQANTTYRVEIQAYDKDGNAILKNSRGVDMPTVVSAKTLRGDQSLRAPNKITRAAGINSVTLNFNNAGNIPSNATHIMVEVWQGKNFVRTEFAELASIRANGNLYVVEDLSRNPNNHNRGLAHQFRIATITNIGEENQTISTFARISQATVSLNKDGRFPAVKNFRVTYHASGQLQLMWNASPVSEVTHYEIGLRNDSSIMGFTSDQLNALESLVETIDGAEIINGIIRFEKSITSTGALALGIGFKENLAIRAVVVNEDGNITAQSANANRSVNVRQ